MTSPRAGLAACVLGAALMAGPATRAVDLPATCATDPLPPDNSTPIPDLKKKVEAEAESDPTAAVRLMCATIPRVAREYGEDSLELAWWVGSLATPLIAYMDKNAEAEPLLDFACPILERRLGPYAAEVADIHVAHAWIDFRQGRLADARAEWESVLLIREHTPGEKKIELQKALVGLAQAQLGQRDFAAARASLQRAQAILAENGDAVSEAAAAIENALTNTAVREEDYAGARSHAEAQIAIERQLQGGAPQLVPAYVLLGQVLERLDEFEQSEGALREAVRLAESKEGPLQKHYLAALTQLGRMLNERGKPDEALGFAQKGAQMGEATLGPDAPALVRVLSSLAEVRRNRGELIEALHLYERSAAIVAHHPGDVERQTLVGYYRGFGALQLNLGDIDAARTTLTTGLEAAGEDPTLSTDRASVLIALAESSRGTDDARSRTQLAQALTLLRSRLPEAHPAILRAINDLCAIEVATDPSSAPDCADAAQRLETAREVEPSLREAVYGNLSRLAEKRGDAASAYALAARSLAAAAALGTPDPLWQANFRMARLLHERGEPSLAILFGKQSIAQIERLRAYFVGQDRRFDRGFLQDKVAVYRTVADWLMEAGRIDEGLEILRLLKTEELYDYVVRDGAAAPDGRGVALTDAERATWERYELALDADAARGAEIDRLSRLAEKGRLSVKERETLAALLAGQRQAEAARTERIRQFLGQAAPSSSQLVPSLSSTPRTSSVSASTPHPGAVLSLDRDLGRFGPDSALAYYILTENHLRILVVTRRGRFDYELPVGAPAMGRDIGRFLDGIGKREDVTAASRALYETLVRPLDEAARRAGAKRLVLWLDGALRYVPFGALSDGKRYLIDKYALEIYAVPSEASRQGNGTRDSALSVLGLGVTKGVGGYAPLPSVAEELCSIVQGPITGLASDSPACRAPDVGDGALRGEGFANAAFTEARFKTLLGGPKSFSVLHLGTHFSLRPGNVLRSYLVLGDGSKLTLDDLRSFDFSGIELLTLSACQTGMGGAAVDDGREVEGLSSLVQSRGAKRVVASLWPVEDASTAKLMGAMYRALGARATDAPGALRRAQLSLRSLGEGGRRPYEHPYYWAGFVVSGSTP